MRYSRINNILNIDYVETVSNGKQPKGCQIHLFILIRNDFHLISIRIKFHEIDFDLTPNEFLLLI